MNNFEILLYFNITISVYKALQNWLTHVGIGDVKSLFEGTCKVSLFFLYKTKTKTCQQHTWFITTHCQFYFHFKQIILFHNPRFRLSHYYPIALSKNTVTSQNILHSTSYSYSIYYQHFFTFFIIFIQHTFSLALPYNTEARLIKEKINEAKMKRK